MNLFERITSDMGREPKECEGAWPCHTLPLPSPLPLPLHLLPLALCHHDVYVLAMAPLQCISLIYHIHTISTQDKNKNKIRNLKKEREGGGQRGEGRRREEKGGEKERGEGEKGRSDERILPPHKPLLAYDSGCWCVVNGLLASSPMGAAASPIFPTPLDRLYKNEFTALLAPPVLLLALCSSSPPPPSHLSLPSSPPLVLSSYLSMPELRVVLAVYVLVDEHQNPQNSSNDRAGNDDFQDEWKK